MTGKYKKSRTTNNNSAALSDNPNAQIKILS